jgi:hypothetical protein
MYYWIMGEVIYVHGKLKDRKFESEIERIRIALLSAENLGEVWPDWEAAFDEAEEMEQKFGAEKALEIFLCRCPLNLTGDLK